MFQFEKNHFKPFFETCLFFCSIFWTFLKIFGCLLPSFSMIDFYVPFVLDLQKCKDRKSCFVHGLEAVSSKKTQKNNEPSYC